MSIRTLAKVAATLTRPLCDDRCSFRAVQSPERMVDASSARDGRIIPTARKEPLRASDTLITGPTRAQGGHFRTLSLFALLPTQCSATWPHQLLRQTQQL